MCVLYVCACVHTHLCICPASYVEYCQFNKLNIYNMAVGSRAEFGLSRCGPLGICVCV